MTKFEVSGKCVSYGTSGEGDWIEIYTGNQSIAVYLSDNFNMGSMESSIESAINSGKTVKASGTIIKSFNDTDRVLLVATELKI